MKKYALILAGAVLTMCLACNKEGKTDIYDALAHETYVESEEAFPNPERGFYFVQSFKSASVAPIHAQTIERQRLLNKTLVYMGYYPKDYMEGDIAPEFLDLMRANMQTLRENGVKCILRFAYSDSEDETPWDPTPEVVQKHIQNITPILQEYGDVILVFQAGFVGVWGEWYYTQHFVSNPTTPEKHALRKQVTDAMLAALPSDRQIALRTPMFARMMYADSYADTLTIATAHNGTDRSRISAFNDCFGASSNDTGTFSGEQTREFWKADSRYVFMGGETCGLSSYCTCEASLKDMEDYHWTYLNSEYHGAVLGRWRKDKCIDEIERRLGYRLSLTDVYTDKAAVAGQDFRVVLKIKNSGFSAPINPRGVELVLVDGNGKKTVYEQKDADPRYWFAGETVTLDRIIKIPADATGECTLYLNLPDPKPTLHDNPLFSIRLANENVWDEENGFNKVATFTL
ncbi:MAG: DUF4832 domain-containing protein [Bacteroidales bacterium]|nr:DUF4832 domain-containing protein [Bacteroidales bacterium]